MLRRPIVGLAVGIVAAGVLVASPALAAPAGSDPSVAASALATRLDTRLAGDSAGSYLDGSGRVVVNVTDAATAKTVTAAGATARYVSHSGAALTSARSTLSAKLTTPGTAFAVDPVGNQVVVSADSTVTGAALAKVKGIVAALGDAARFEQLPGTLSTTVSGGDAISTEAGAVPWASTSAVAARTTS
jgi:streptogrisin D